ncbi:Zn-ribbon domain-containing OB-fold protein [Bacillus rubiinfantis]|uniref:Zn-ribbon domain-containing OB-fold protein n=1 Tax=Bacillus rubiinfantis TaxID=1499680 RepID=UPI000694357C|nr:OB-fold domain-containing protein [Bacillus rubiinfantis]
MVQYNKQYPIPRPDVNEDTIDYWKLLQETRQLHVQKCKNCGTYSHPPRPVCHQCRHYQLEWVPTSGKGTVYSFVIYYRSVHPGFEVPYGVVLVELVEGVRIISNMVDCKPEEIYIGMPVELVVDQVWEDLALPKFKRRNT